MKHEIIVTGDGSKTIYLPELDETYHSSHGSLQEAMHVFIQNGLSIIDSNKVSVFEMGFGTGLNALLTAIETNKVSGKQVYYEGIEAYPVAFDIAMEMDYCKLVGEQYQSVFKFLHETSWKEVHCFSEQFSFQKIHEKIEDYQPKREQFDIVYYDAFGPRAQEAMWTPEILQKMYDMLRVGGFLVTYCAKGQVKRDLKALGFEIEALPGPPGKREMTRAWKR
ncbi:MAG TPA: tRNA (5-methylaminomethyl-2-thiouridine)(34)-methyltransferase MnmD [Taishania sp.]|nr:tRNA (5-methylaminomethyl-2-thiouridine)(34)-methyltransferase MnmD [Taishania sp.]